MRILLLLLLAPTALLADSLDCRSAGLNPGVLTPQQWDALGTSSASSDPILLEGRFLFSKASKSISAKEMHNASPIPWETASKMILLGSVNRIFKDYPGIYLATRSGRVYASKIVGVDDVMTMVTLIDPCHAFVTVTANQRFERTRGSFDCPGRASRVHKVP
jgi:hypothetical protein